MKNIYFALLLFFAACSTIPAGQTGYASWYGGKFHGRKTANGEIFDTYKFTAAHRSLPFDTVLKVTNLENGRSTVVRINDRGPFVENRVIDLSFAAAKEIGMIESGIARVRIEIIEGNGEKADNFVYKIQIGAFSDRKNAIAMLEKLGESGIKGTIESGSSGIHRVVVADISPDSLESVEKTLAGRGFRDYLLKKEIKL